MWLRYGSIVDCELKEEWKMVMCTILSKLQALVSVAILIG